MAKTNARPLWFVSQIDLVEDSSKPRIIPERGIVQPEDGPQPAVGRNQRPARLGDIPVAVGGGDGYGFQMMRNNVITLAFTSREAARLHAKDLAGKTPKIAYGVFACVDVYETTAPEVIEKKFNDAGELVLVTLEKKDEVAESTI